jgi:hypothetical protein
VAQKRKKFAENTEVAPEKSRMAINHILQTWGVQGIQWTDMFDLNQVILQFVWSPEGQNQSYMAKLKLKLPTDEQLAEEAKHARSRKVLEGKLERLKDRRGWREHRLLHIFLKGSFEAIENGVITAEQLFLPWLVGSDGRTVSEVVGPRLGTLVTNSAEALMPAHEEESDQ